MKNLLKIFLALTAVITLGCKDDTTDHVSFITTYAVIDLKAPQLQILEKGTPFTETAVATIAGDEVPLSISGDVDVNTPGIYTVTYSATNKDKFVRTTTRQIVVFDPAADATDLSGTYARDLNGVVVHVEKVSPCVYHIDDAGGLGSSFLDILFVNTEGNTLIIPTQVAPASGITVASVPGTGEILEDGFTWVLNASSTYGSAVRTFIKI